VLSVLRYTDSDYPFGIFKHFLANNCTYTEYIAIVVQILNKSTLTSDQDHLHFPSKLANIALRL